MVQIINHDLRSHDGGTIFMPPYIGGEVGWGNLAIPDPHIVTAIQRYPRGTMFRKGNRSWAYSKLYTTTRTGGIWGSTGYGGITAGLGLFSVAKTSSSLTIVTGTKGERTLTISSPSLGTANAYAGGLLSIYESAKRSCILAVVSHTDTVITLDGILPDTYTAQANSNAYLVPSPYHNVVSAGISSRSTAVYDYCPGIFNSPNDEDGNEAAVNDFVWLQTAGPCTMWVSHSYRGGAGGERVTYIMGGGTAQVADSSNTSAMHYQRIGTLFPGTGSMACGNHVDDATGGTDVTMMEHIVMLDIRQ